MTDTKRPGRFQLSQDRQVLEARIIASFRDRTTDYEYVLTYFELSELVGANVKTGNMSTKLTQAIKSINNENAWKLGRDPVRGGVVMLRPEQFDAVGESIIRSVRRKAKRGAAECARMSTLDGVSAETKNGLQAKSAVLAASAAFNGRKAIDRVGEQIKIGGGGPLSIPKVIDAYRKA